MFRIHILTIAQKNLLLSLGVVASFLCLSNVHAQSYTTSLGLRVSDDLGFSLGQKITKRTTLEGLYSGNWFSDDEQLMVIVRHHYPLLSTRLNVYLGMGYGCNFGPNEMGLSKQHLVPLQVGCEFSISRFTISADFMPQFIVGSEDNPTFYKNSGVSLRYIIVKKRRKKPIKNWLDGIKEKFKRSK